MVSRPSSVLSKMVSVVWLDLSGSVLEGSVVKGILDLSLAMDSVVTTNLGLVGLVGLENLSGLGALVGLVDLSGLSDSSVLLGTSEGSVEMFCLAFSLTIVLSSADSVVVLEGSGLLGLNGLKEGLLEVSLTVGLKGLNVGLFEASVVDFSEASLLVSAEVSVATVVGLLNLDLKSILVGSVVGLVNTNLDLVVESVGFSDNLSLDSVDCGTSEVDPVGFPVVLGKKLDGLLIFKTSNSLVAPFLLTA